MELTDSDLTLIAKGKNTKNDYTESDDFNAKIDSRRTPEECDIGTHDLQWNEQEGRLSDFIMTTKTTYRNSQFQLSSLPWTWESSAEGHHTEIDHIIVSKKFCLTDVAVVPEFYTHQQ
ncbi:hypothetical protein NECAME_10216 [Necator americanus]|uniref:Endonuclease/exonuclease/phosphatase domain-containing protein n=1 Tax=Necator americanus TaxID=51031 RepID=W2T9C6_NECAM|nr:hypothetical protein NECAME_10216 [Necator americanus]ETN78630.1 hypothetical protein NECAME_10216 [Necator americanus]